MLNRVGDKIHPCLTPMVVRNQSPSVPFMSTALVALSYKLCTTRMMSAVMLYLLILYSAPLMRGDRTLTFLLMNPSALLVREQVCVMCFVHFIS